MTHLPSPLPRVRPACNNMPPKRRGPSSPQRIDSTIAAGRAGDTDDVPSAVRPTKRLRRTATPPFTAAGASAGDTSAEVATEFAGTASLFTEKDDDDDSDPEDREVVALADSDAESEDSTLQELRTSSEIKEVIPDGGSTRS